MKWSAIEAVRHGKTIGRVRQITFDFTAGALGHAIMRRHWQSTARQVAHTGDRLTIGRNTEHGKRRGITRFRVPRRRPAARHAETALAGKYFCIASTSTTSVKPIMSDVLVG